MKSKFRTLGTTVRAATVAAVCALGFGACGLDDLSVPELGGPSASGIQIRMEALPDVITADGFSTALIRLTVYDQNGSRASGRTILLAIASSNLQFADIGTLNATTGTRLRAAEAQVVTDSNGQASAIYTAPPRTDFTADSSVTIRARAVGTDFNGDIYNFVRIELKSAEPRLFPLDPENDPPNCSFVVEAPQGSTSCDDTNTCTVRVNTSVLFQTTSSDDDGTIVRYEWFFQDGTPVVYAPDTNHVFRSTGDFDVVHRVTDNSGGLSSCTATISVRN